MADSLARQLPSPQRKNLAARLPDGESLLKSLETAEQRRALGRLLGHAFLLGDITKQQVATTLGYTTQAAVSRWCAGAEAPPLHRLLNIPAVRRGLMLALAIGAPGVDVVTEIRIRKGA